jgi:hypothetical protein
MYSDADPNTRDLARRSASPSLANSAAPPRRLVPSPLGKDRGEGEVAAAHGDDKPLRTSAGPTAYF